MRALLILLLSVWTLPGVAQSTPGSLSAASAAEASVSGEPSAADLEHARNLFQRGVALADQGQFGAAAQRFRDALALRPAPAVEYNLASALFELRQYDESFNRVQSVLRDAATNDALRARAQKLERALYPYVARLTVTASSTAAEDVSVSVDGTSLDPAWMGVPRAVKAGPHQLSAERQGHRVSEREVQVPLRTAVIVDVSLIITEGAAQAVVTSAEVAAPGPLDPLASPERAARDDGTKRRKLWLWTGIAAGVVLLGAGVALGVVLSKQEPKQAAGATGDFMPGVLTWK